MRKIFTLFRKKKDVPQFTTTPGDGYTFINTMEGCLLSGSEVYRPVRAVFRLLPYEYRYKLVFAPKDGEFAQRMRFWKEVLQAAELSNKQYHATLRGMLEWCIHIKKLERKV